MPIRTRQNSRRGSAETPAAGNLADQIRRQRHKIGISQRELATRLGVTAGAVGQWELGLKAPSMPRLVKLSKVLNVSLDMLLGTSGEAAAQDLPRSPDTEDLLLIEEARRLDVDLRQVVAEARRRRWLEDNRGALEDANTFLSHYGLWSDGRRQF